MKLTFWPHPNHPSKEGLYYKTFFNVAPSKNHEYPIEHAHDDQAAEREHET